jgi:hypothetical protein
MLPIYHGFAEDLSFMAIREGSNCPARCMRGVARNEESMREKNWEKRETLREI